MLAFLIGIILVVVAAVFGWRFLKKHRVKHRVPVLILGLVVFFVALVVILSYIFPDKAVAENHKIYKNLNQLHASLICDNGDSGDGPDNSTPWYTAYYYVDGTSNTEQKIRDFAANSGYQLTTDTAYINQLQGKDSVEPYGNEAFNTSSVYLTGTNHNKTLQLTIAKNGSVPAYCDTGTYGRSVSVKPGKYILYTTITIN